MIAKIPLALEPQPEGGYTVTSPLLPELITEGDTIAECLANAEDAFAVVLEIYEDEERPLPPAFAWTIPKAAVRRSGYLRPLIAGKLPASCRGWGATRSRHAAAVLIGDGSVRSCKADGSNPIDLSRRDTTYGAIDARPGFSDGGGIYTASGNAV